MTVGMGPRTRKFALTLHVVASVGWLGAVGAYLVLAAAALRSEDVALVRGAYPLMELVMWAAVVPLSLGSLLTGVISALGGPWGLVRHYWVLFKLVLNLVATTLLLLYTRSIGHFADLAPTARDVGALRDPTHVLHSVLALLVLLVATVLAVFKPRGVTGFGRARRAVP
ncbi:DUF2269 domain-containing protein [Actinokineospora xionganensis]|nr:DUF2269 domain-containing protein [Actinokineospora xionganensis]